MSSSTLVRGTAILTIGLFLSKALGLLYLIPLYAIVGKESMGLYQYAYIPYNLALSIAISGAPLAVSKYVSKYSALGDYQTGHRLMKSGMAIMLATGLISFITLYFLATPIAEVVRQDDEQIYTVEQISSVIRWVSFALLVVPIMSIIRGFFQGHQKMEPTAVSQLVEQIVRVIVVLAGASFVIYFMKGSPEMAINFAVFAAFIGALAGLLVLYRYWLSFKPAYQRMLETSIDPEEKVSFFSMYKELIGYLIPFILVGVINPLYQFVDMLTFNEAMASIGLASVSDVYLGMLNLLTHKFVMVPVMVATGFSMALIPVMTSYYTNGNHKGLIRSLDQTFQLMMFFMLPMVIGIMLLSTELYTFLYEYDEAGAFILKNYVPVAILFGLFTVTAAILQGIDRHKWIVFTGLLGLLFKLVLNIPLIQHFETQGAILATAIGYSVAVGINLIVITKTLRYDSKDIVKRFGMMIVINIAMIAAVYATMKGLYVFGVPYGRFQAFVYSMVGALVGAIVYGWLSLKTGLAQDLLGPRLDRWLEKLNRLKKRIFR